MKSKTMFALVVLMLALRHKKGSATLGPIDTVWPTEPLRPNDPRIPIFPLLNMN